MEAGITDHVWSVEELVTRALAAEPCAVPEPKPLAPPAPPPGEKPATARQTSTGGWLRVVQGGKSVQKDAPNEAMPPVAPAAKPVVESLVMQESVRVTPASIAKPATAPTTTTAIPVKLVARRWEQLDLFGGNRTETRASYGDDSEDCPY
jgi:hypothetical protein